MVLKVAKDKWTAPINRGPPRLQTPATKYETAHQKESMLQQNELRKSQGVEYSQVLLPPELNNKVRFCIDFRV